MDHPNLRVQNRELFESAPLDPIGSAYAEIQIARLKGGYPFNKSITPGEEESALARLLNERLEGGLGDSMAVVVVRNPGYMSRAVLQSARKARETADTTNALLYYRAALNWQPFNKTLAAEVLSFGLQSPRHDEIMGDILQFVVTSDGTIDQSNALAAIRIRQGRLDEASALLDDVEQRDPNSRTMAFNKARLLVMRGDTVLAKRYFEVSQGGKGGEE
jgi:Flp pilus assembly protein TadD